MAKYMVAKNCKPDEKSPVATPTAEETVALNTNALTFPYGCASEAEKAFPEQSLGIDMPESGPQSSVHRVWGDLKRKPEQIRHRAIAWKNHFVELGGDLAGLLDPQQRQLLRTKIQAKSDQTLAALQRGEFQAADVRIAPPITGMGFFGTMARNEAMAANLGRAESIEVGFARTTRTEEFLTKSAPVEGDAAQWGNTHGQIWETSLVARGEAQAIKAKDFTKSSDLMEYAKAAAKLIRDGCRVLRDGSSELAKVVPAWTNLRGAVLQEGSHPDLLIGKLISELPQGLQEAAMAAREAALRQAQQVTKLSRSDKPVEGVEPGSTLRLNADPGAMRFDSTTGELLVWEHPFVPPAMGYLKMGPSSGHELGTVYFQGL